MRDVLLQDRLDLVEEVRPLLLISGGASLQEQRVNLWVVVLVAVPWPFGEEEVPVAVVGIGVGDAPVEDPVVVAGEPALIPGCLLQLFDLDVETEFGELIADDFGWPLDRPTCP